MRDSKLKSAVGIEQAVGVDKLGYGESFLRLWNRRCGVWRKEKSEECPTSRPRAGPRACSYPLPSTHLFFSFSHGPARAFTSILPGIHSVWHTAHCRKVQSKHERSACGTTPHSFSTTTVSTYAASVDVLFHRWHRQSGGAVLSQLHD